MIGVIVAAAYSPLTFPADKSVLECPQVMAHVPVKSKYPGWFVYSNKPLRLSGADIRFIGDSHLEGTLDPDRVERLNDRDLSIASVFDLLKHRDEKPFSLDCHYGVHAQLSREISDELIECTVIRHVRFGEEGEFKVSCQ